VSLLLGLVTGDSDTVTDSIDLIEVALMLLNRPASFQQDTTQGRSQ
jgi:hypothetical protein